MDDSDNYSFFEAENQVKLEETYGGVRRVLSHSEEMLIKEKELQALDELVNILSKECREYLLYKLQVTPLTTPRRLPYSLIKNTDVQKNLRHTLMLAASLISKGDPHGIMIETAEDLHVARTLSIDDPYQAVNVRKRRRQAHTSTKEDLASRLLTNLAVAYKQNCKKRSEKKRILSISANEITYSEGRRLFGCGPVQFSEAKKHFAQFGPFAETKANICPDKTIIESFKKRFAHTDESIIWKEFCICHKEVAERIGREAFIQKIRGTPPESSLDSIDDVFAESPEVSSYLNNE